MMRDFRKPLIIMTPKSLLRHKLAVSPKADFLGESAFHRFLWDPETSKMAKGDKIRRVVLCSGKVYYDLYEERQKRALKDVMLIRVEQLYPFPSAAPLGKELEKYPNADVVWCQEEPRNMGAWQFVNEKIEADAGRGQAQGRPREIHRPPRIRIPRQRPAQTPSGGAGETGGRSTDSVMTVKRTTIRHFGLVIVGIWFLIAPAVASTPVIGSIGNDGTVYAGISPDSGKDMYGRCRPMAQQPLKWEAAVKYCSQLDGNQHSATGACRQRTS